MAKNLKCIGLFILYAILCLAVAVPGMAEDTMAVGSVKYYKVNTETGAESFAYSTDTTREYRVGAGTYKAKIDVYNYDTQKAMSAIFLTGVFDDSNILQTVYIDEKTAIENGAAVTLENEMTITQIQRFKSYLWTSMSSLAPVGEIEPAAPANVTVDSEKITNSTVEISWDAPTDVNAVSYYNIYRNDELVGTAAASETGFKDVGIEHNTEVSYTVETVDAVGNVSAKSEATEPVFTDDIARLWFGAAALTADDKTQITDDNYEALMETDRGAYNFDIVDVFSNETETVSSTEYATSIRARNASSTLTSGETLGLNAIDFDMPLGRVITTLTPEFLEKISDEKEIKVIVNYMDTRTIGAAVNPGTVTYDTQVDKQPTHVIKYYSDAGSGLTGTTGYQTTAGANYTKQWGTNVMTVPTVNATEGTFPNVYSNRKLKLETTKSSAAGWGSTGGMDAMFAIGNNNKTHTTGDYTAIMQKVDIAAADYVPYGAVLDFDKQEDTQFVEFSRKSDVNQGAIAAVEGKTAMKLFADENSTAKLRQLTLGMSKTYITSTDNKLILRVTYLNNNEDTANSQGLQVIYMSTSGSNDGTHVITRGTNSKTGKELGAWVTEEIVIDNAALSTYGSGNLILSTSAGESIPWYISRVEVIKK